MFFAVTADKCKDCDEDRQKRGENKNCRCRRTQKYRDVAKSLKPCIERSQMDETFLIPVFFLPVTCGIPPFPFEALFDTSECNRNDKKTLPTICQPAYFSCATRGCKRFKGLRTFLNKRFRISFVLHVVHFKIAHIS